MKLWKCRYSVCSECGVHFEPVPDYEAQYGNLCSMHRKPVKERDEKRAAVISWATANWERLVKTMEEDNEKQMKEYMQTQQKIQMAFAQYKPSSDLGSLGVVSPENYFQG